MSKAVSILAFLPPILYTLIRNLLGVCPMQCCDTGGRLPAVRIEMPVDLARDISYLLRSIQTAGGNGRIILEVLGGNVTSTEMTVKRPRKRSA